VKRFYKTVSIESADHGYGVLLDGKPILTPARAALRMPTFLLAEAIMLEWDAQGETIAPISMPLTRHANSVIDRISTNRDDIINIISRYGETDLICYRASHPADLVARQSMQWDPMIGWAQQAFGADLLATTGIERLQQPIESIRRLSEVVASHSIWQLAALHDAVTISGSLVLGLALTHNRLTTEEMWRAGQLDELFQAERWGEDSLATQARANRRDALETAARLLDLLKTN
jgi:chaperone required for assembly of F1-ATPase